LLLILISKDPLKTMAIVTVAVFLAQLLFIIVFISVLILNTKISDKRRRKLTETEKGKKTRER